MGRKTEERKRMGGNKKERDTREEGRKWEDRSEDEREKGGRGRKEGIEE